MFFYFFHTDIFSHLYPTLFREKPPGAIHLAALHCGPFETRSTLFVVLHVLRNPAVETRRPAESLW